MQADDKTGVYNIGTGKETDINTVFNLLKRETKSNCEEIHAEGKEGEQRRSCLDAEKAKKELGWKPKTKIEEGIKETVKWFKGNV